MLTRTHHLDPALREAFDAAFSAQDPGHQARSEAVWAWRTREVPAGAPFVTLRDGAGVVLAHYGALAQQVLFQGTTLRAAQAVDTFAASHLPPLRRARAFRAACQAFIEENCRADGLGFCWGFPVRSAWRLGSGELGYSFWQEFLDLARPVRPSGTARFDLDLHSGGPWPEGLGAFFAREAPFLCFARNAEFMTWLFDRAPDLRYGKILLMRGTDLCGWAVWRRREIEGEGVLVVVDRFCVRGDGEAAGALEAYLDDAARASGCSFLKTSLGSSDRDLSSLQALGWRVRPSPYALVGRSFGADPDDAVLARELRWTLADSDLE